MNLQQTRFAYRLARRGMRVTIGLSFAWMLISCTGCRPAGGGSPTVFTSKDGRVSITAPAGWEKYTYKTKRRNAIGIRNRDQNGWGEVIIESKSDLKAGLTLSGYADIVLEKVAVKATSPTENIKDRIVSDPTSLTINGYSAVRYEIRSTVQNTKLIYARTFFETPDFFVQVMLWTVPSALAENQADFDSIAGSLSQIK